MKKELLLKTLALGIIVLLILVSLSGVFGYQTEVKENNNSTSEASPDINLVRIYSEYDLDWGYHLHMVMQNIGDAPTEIIRYHSDIYYFGIYQGRSQGQCSPLKAGENTTFHVTEFGDGPVFGLFRFRCYAETTNYEKNLNNNFFAHSYFIIFIIVLFGEWIFKEMPW